MKGSFNYPKGLRPTQVENHGSSRLFHFYPFLHSYLSNSGLIALYHGKIKGCSMMEI